MEEQASALAAGIEGALPGWVERSVRRRLGRHDEEVMRAAAAAGREARVVVGSRVRALLAADIDQQAATPLSLVRDAVSYPTAVLRAAGVEPVGRDDFSVERFPDDVYDLSPATLADLDPSLVDLGIAWGAAKAWTHKRRHAAGEAGR